MLKYGCRWGQIVDHIVVVADIVQQLLSHTYSSRAKCSTSLITSLMYERTFPLFSKWPRREFSNFSSNLFEGGNVLLGI